MHPHYREECRKMLEPILLQVEEYLTYPEGFDLLGVVSVEGSPSCGYEKTCEGEWGGELASDVGDLLRVCSTCRMEAGSGVLMQILEDELRKRRMNLPIMSMEKALELLSQK
jgi:predicted secreted protein